MRNLKKVLALVVAVAMLASMGLVVTAASYTDVASTASYADAVNLLSNLGIIKGYEDGTFKPNNTVTRAEAATMMVRMLALDDEVEAGDSNFTDVKADDWFSGYVNVAEANGIINGMGDGTFNPNGEVTYGQIVKMIVCALGYEPVANAHGGYLGGGYLYAGSAQVTGFTKGVAGTANGAASRATVARLIYNALEVELMEQTSFSTGITGSEFTRREGVTILNEYLGLEKVEGVIVETYLSDYDFDASEADKTVKMIITKNFDADPVYTADNEIVPFVADGTDAATLLGQAVVAYVGENEEDVDAIFAVAPKANRNETVVVDADLVKSLNVDLVEYYKSSSARTAIEVEIDGKVAVKGFDKDMLLDVNNVVINGYNVNSDETLANVVDELGNKVTSVTFLNNDSDDDFEFIFVTMPVSGKMVELVVDKIDSEDYILEALAGEDLPLDLEDDKKIYTIVKDGKIVEFDAIEEGDVVTILDNESNNITVYVSSTVVTGTIDEVDDGVYTISGKDYEYTVFTDDEAEEYDAGEEGKFYINSFGQIVYFDSSSSIDVADYVYMIALGVEDTTFETQAATYLVKVVTAAGVVETLEIRAKNVDIYEGSEDAAYEDQDAADVYDYLKGTGSFGEDVLVDPETGRTRVENSTGLLAKIDTNAAGEITAIYMPEYGTDAVAPEDAFFYGSTAYVNDAADGEETASYNERRSTYGEIDLTDDVVIFNVDDEEFTTSTNNVTADAITTTTVGKTFVDDSSYSFTAIYEDGEVKALIVTEGALSLDATAPFMVVTKASTVKVDDEYADKLTGLVNGETVTIIVDPEDDGAGQGYAKGDVIVYTVEGDYAVNVELVLDAGEVIADAQTGLADSLTNILVNDLSDEDVTVNAGEPAEYNSNKKSFELDGQKFYLADDANVTVVEYTGTSLTVNKGKGSDLNDRLNYIKYAVVKTLVDEELEVSDAVVFVKYEKASDVVYEPETEPATEPETEPATELETSTEA